MMGTISAAASGGASSNRLVGIEAGRGIAASLVVLYHVSRHLDQAFGAPMLVHAFQFGHSGVDFFFVISGFIILFVHYRDIDNPLRLCIQPLRGTAVHATIPDLLGLRWR